MTKVQPFSSINFFLQTLKLKLNIKVVQIMIIDLILVFNSCVSDRFVATIQIMFVNSLQQCEYTEKLKQNKIKKLK